ncbi:MAG: heteromeric transposase endonuclease subunit TnsA, partial [Desulfobulbaceae bacterium]|nr:heteromeric transposase endonuclease subunit TnsA [Desulfobulbaceae bacterium]
GETSIPYESTLERDFLIRKEFCLSVLDVIPQPCQIPFTTKRGQSFVYTPDFLVYYHLGNREYGDYPKPVLVEVKPEKEWRMHWRKWLPKWKAAWLYAQEQGWEFHIRDECRIRDQSFENIKFLERYKRMRFPVEESRWVIENVRKMGSTQFHYILARHFMGGYRAEGIAHIWHLLAVRLLDCDISRPLNDFTELWVPTNE